MSAPTRSGADGGRDPAASGTSASTASSAARESHPASALRGVVVRMEAGPDRRTIYPRELTDEKRLTTWLSADATVFVDLDEWR